jgi:ArsR family transcriptional regulator
MDKEGVLAALAQEHRLEVYRLLVQAGPGRMAAGGGRKRARHSTHTLSFHFDRLRHAGLVSFERRGWSLHAAGLRRHPAATRLRRTFTIRNRISVCEPADPIARPARTRDAAEGNRSDGRQVGQEPLGGRHIAESLGTGLLFCTVVGSGIIAERLAGGIGCLARTSILPSAW